MTLNLPEIAFAALATSLSLTTCAKSAVLGETRDHRQQVALTRSVVADNEYTLVVGRRLELKIGDHQVAQLLGHTLSKSQTSERVAARRQANSPAQAGSRIR